MAVAVVLALALSGRWGAAGPNADGIELADGPGGLAVVSAPGEIELPVGGVVLLPLSVENFHRSLTLRASTLIHTFVGGATPSRPGEVASFAAGAVTAPETRIELQTLRLRPHELELEFEAGDEAVSVTLTLVPRLTPRTPLFGIACQPFPDGIPPPYTTIYGPDCGSCPTTTGDPEGTTRDRECAGTRDSCTCHIFDVAPDSEAEARTREAAPGLQRFAGQILRTWSQWPSIETAPGRFLWPPLDWVLDGVTLSPLERDYSPLLTGVMYASAGWVTCASYANPDGSSGFFDPDNDELVARFSELMSELGNRYAGQLRFVEMGNEPANEFYLCPCTVPGGPPCTAAAGPNQPACASGPDSPEFVAAYGDLLLVATETAAAELQRSDPDALVVTGALEIVGGGNHHLTQTTRYMISQGLLTSHENVVVGIHQFPYPSPPPWLDDGGGAPLDCSYYQPGHDIFWLPEGCETAPPFEDFTTYAGRPVAAREAWRELDRRTDLSGLFHDAEELGVLDRFYLFDTELHGGFHDRYGDEPNTATTPAREAVAALRIGAINAHQRVLGTEFVHAPADPSAYDVLVRHLAGATPVYRWGAPLMDADYSSVVYKLFTRGSEDIIVAWSNDRRTLSLLLTPAPGAVTYQRVRETTVQDAGGAVEILAGSFATPPPSITVHPLTQVVFLSVISSAPGFGWLNDLTPAAAPPARHPDGRVAPTRKWASEERRGGPCRRRVGWRRSPCTGPRRQEKVAASSGGSSLRSEGGF